MKNFNKKYNITGKRFTPILNFFLTCRQQLTQSERTGGGILTTFLYAITSFLVLTGSEGTCQTTVCTGDPVTLTLNGYNGMLQWQQSPDLTTWSPAAGVAVANDTFGFNATNTYYYRAKVTDGSCLPFYSDTVLVSTVNAIPDIPIANSASGISQTFFSANWSPSPGATAYYLDVAIDAGFTSFVSGYNGLNVSNVSTYAVTGLNCNTPYYYRVMSSNVCGRSIASNTITVTTSFLPATPTAKSASNITQSSFSANWSVSSGSSTYYLDVSTDVDFVSFVPGYNDLDVGNDTNYTVTGLACSTPYYYRVRANNSCGNSSNSSTISVTAICGTTPYCGPSSTCSGNIVDSRDGKTYATVQIANQCWMAENLNVGIRIDRVNEQTSGPDNQNTSIQKYCYDNDSVNCAIYGGYYQWDETMAYQTSVNTNGPGPQGICPTGWHIPTDNEWKCLEMNLGMTQLEVDGTAWRGTDEGGKLKEVGTTHWSTPNTGATNSSGFTALPGGFRDVNGNIQFIDLWVYWWSATEVSNSAYNCHLRYDTAQAIRGGDSKKVGYSVRCIKD